MAVIGIRWQRASLWLRIKGFGIQRTENLAVMFGRL